MHSLLFIFFLFPVLLFSKEPKQYTLEQFLTTTRYQGIDFTYDEKDVLVSSNQTGISNIYKVPVEGGTPSPCTFSQDASLTLLCAFPKDPRFLYNHDVGGNEQYHLYVQNPDKSKIDLTPVEGTRADFHSVSQGEKSFYFAWNNRDKKAFDLYETAFDTLKPTCIYVNKENRSIGPVSEDQRYIALMEVQEFYKTAILLFDRKLNSYTPIQKADAINTASCFSPDSKYLYYTTDKDAEFPYLVAYDIETKEHHIVDKKDKAVVGTRFSPTGRYRITTYDHDALFSTEIIDTTTGKPLSLPLDGKNRSEVTFSPSEEWVAWYSDGAKNPQDLYTYNLQNKKLFRCTDSLNKEIDPNDLVEQERVRYTSFDGLSIPAILYKPLGCSKENKAPALVWVHGGPGGQSRVNYSGIFQYLVNHGYALLAVNNRGSSGYGKTFFGAADKKHGDVDLQDVVAAKKYLIDTGYIDPEKIAIIGGSYGGYITLAALTFFPNTFALGVDIFGVSNWTRTLKSIPSWFESEKLALYSKIGDPYTQEAYLDSISPLFYADRIRKPLMVIQGRNDPRVLQIESDEIVEKAKKHTEVEYLLLDDEGHGFAKRENAIKIWSAIHAFLDKYLRFPS